MALIKIQTALSLSKHVLSSFRSEYFSTTSVNLASKSFDQTTTGKWLSYNEKIYEPQRPDEEPRPAVKFCLF